MGSMSFIEQRIHDRFSMPSMFEAQRTTKPKNTGLFVYKNGVRQVMRNGRLQPVSHAEPKIEPYRYPEVTARVQAAKAKAANTKAARVHAMREEYLRLVEAS